MNEENNTSVGINSKKTKFLTFFIIGIIVSSIIFVVYRPRQSQTTRSITLSEISVHNSKEDCWTTIEGDVYDISKFISQHKGGDKILNACGVDATDLFTGKSSFGRVHSNLANKLLSKMKIGKLTP